jgi:hypothetical protein
MKKFAFASVLVLFAISLASPWLASARSAGPSASGIYRFTLDDDLTKSLEFNASSDERGVTTGHMTFLDEATIREQDVDGTGEEPREDPPAFSMEADLDTLTIENNRAVMSGVVRSSSRENYVGRWVQLVVEDNSERPDKFSWRFCQVEADGWTPQDSEDPRDEGAWWHWWATDAEREDDRGVASRNIVPDRTRRCEVQPLSSYTFDDVKSGSGEIQVQP